MIFLHIGSGGKVRLRWFWSRCFGKEKKNGPYRSSPLRRPQATEEKPSLKLNLSARAISRPRLRAARSQNSIPTSRDARFEHLCEFSDLVTWSVSSLLIRDLLLEKDQRPCPSFSSDEKLRQRNLRAERINTNGGCQEKSGVLTRKSLIVRMSGDFYSSQGFAAERDIFQKFSVFYRITP